MLDDSLYILRDGMWILREEYGLTQRNSGSRTQQDTQGGMGVAEENPHGDEAEDSSVFDESSQQSEVVLFIARAVGVMVLVTAIILVILFLVFARAILAFLISRYGITGVLFMVGILVYCCMKYGRVSTSALFNTFSRCVS